MKTLATLLLIAITTMGIAQQTIPNYDDGRPMPRGGYNDVFALHFEGHYGIQLMDYNALNAQYLSLDLQPLDERQVFYGGHFGGTLNESASMGINFFLLEKNTQQIGDSMQVVFGGYGIKTSIGGDLAPMEFLEVVPYFGYGFSRLKLTQTTIRNDGGNAGFFQTRQEEIINRNPAVILDVGIANRINIKFISIGIRGGYQIDVSNKRWRYDGHRISGGPKTSLSGMYGIISASFFIRS